MRRRRWRSRVTRSGSGKKVALLSLLVFMLFSLQSFIFLERNLKPPLMALAKVRLRQIATQAINSAISDRIASGTNYDRLIEWKSDNNGKINGFVLNYAEHMKITADAINTVQGQLEHLKAMPEHIPLGQAMGSAILASFGPNIPIKLVPQGDVQVDLDTKYENAGINMILVEVYIRVHAEVSVIIPYDSEPEVVETEIPISYVLVVGDTPMYYFDNKGNPLGNSQPVPPSVALPDLSKGIDGGKGAVAPGGESGNAAGGAIAGGAAQPPAKK